MLVTVYKIEFTSRKTLITFTCSLLYTHIRLLLFSLKHMACHAFTHEISDWNKHLSHNVFSVCPNWATLLYPNKFWKIPQATFVSPFRYAAKKKKERVGKTAIANLFALHSNAISGFYIITMKSNLDINYPSKF